MNSSTIRNLFQTKIMMEHLTMNCLSADGISTMTIILVPAKKRINWCRSSLKSKGTTATPPFPPTGTSLRHWNYLRWTCFQQGGKSRYEHLKVNETPVVRSVDGKFVLKILGTLRTFSSLQWCEFSAESGGILESESHDSVSLENLTLFSGKLIVVSGTEIRELNSGETL